MQKRREETHLEETHLELHLKMLKEIRRGDKKFSIDERFSVSLLLAKRGPKGNTLLHAAARYGNWSMMNRVLENVPCYLLTNNNEETPIHIAAKAGNIGALYRLLDAIENPTENMTEEPEEKLLKMKDKEGNTALHNAVRNGHENIVIDLIEYYDDPKDYVNNAGESPLSIAIDAKLTSIARYIIRKKPSSLDHKGPNESTLLHTAVMRDDYYIMMEILRCKRELIDILDAQKMNPLHYAAVSGNGKMARCLLCEKPTLVYQGDTNGQTPLHLAAKKGQLRVLKMLFNYYPDVIDALDGRDRNILHVAAEQGIVEIVSFILTLADMEDLINSLDKDGNTPLHLAAKNFHSDVVYTLSRNKKVNIRATNRNTKTPLEIVEMSEVKGKDIEKHLTIKALKAAYADRALVPADDYKEKPQLGINDTESQGGQGKDMAQTLSVMATLIATFTFTAAFTIPGGFRSDGTSEEGIAILVRRRSFQAFIITDTIAMTSSMTAAVVVFWSFWRSKTEYVMDLLPLAIGLTWVGLVSMTLAFVTGLFAVLSTNMALAVMVCFIGCAFPFIFYVFAPFFQLLFDYRPAKSVGLSELNPFAYTFRMVVYFLKPFTHWDFRRPLRRRKDQDQTATFSTFEAIKTFLKKPFGWCFRAVSRGNIDDVV